MISNPMTPEGEKLEMLDEDSVWERSWNTSDKNRFLETYPMLRELFEDPCLSKIEITRAGQACVEWGTTHTWEGRDDRY